MMPIKATLVAIHHFCSTSNIILLFHWDSRSKEQRIKQKPSNNTAKYKIKAFNLLKETWCRENKLWWEFSRRPLPQWDVSYEYSDLFYNQIHQYIPEPQMREQKAFYNWRIEFWVSKKAEIQGNHETCLCLCWC